MITSYRRHRHALFLLVAAVSADVVLSLVLLSSLAGRRHSRSVLGGAGLVCAALVLYALLRVLQSDRVLRQRLHDEMARVRAMQDITTDWLWETTPHGVLTYSSPQLMELLGYSAESALGRDAHDFMAPRSARAAREAFASGTTVAGWKDWSSTWLTVDGRRVRLQLSGSPLYDGKGRLLGYRGFCRPSTGARAETDRVAAIRERVDAVLREGSLAMALQPIISVATGRLVGAEALARFPDGRAPNLWFDDAGAVGLRFELEAEAIRAACRRLPELPPDAFLSVNAGPEVISDTRFTAMLLEEISAPERLVLEVTEHVMIEEYDVVRSNLAQLRSAGVRIAVDDAGAGFASLSHVLHLKPDVVKLDRSLISDVDKDKARRSLVTALALLALDIEATLTAEGVETAAELEALADLGVDHAQGYLVGRPTLEGFSVPSRPSAGTRGTSRAS